MKFRWTIGYLEGWKQDFDDPVGSGQRFQRRSSSLRILPYGCVLLLFSLLQIL
jgi:hypothetical protein